MGNPSEMIWQQGRLFKGITHRDNKNLFYLEVDGIRVIESFSSYEVTVKACEILEKHKAEEEGKC